MQCNANPCTQTLIIPSHVQDQLLHLSRVQVPDPPPLAFNRRIPLSLHKEESQATVVHPLRGERPAEDNGVPGEEAVELLAMLWRHGVLWECSHRRCPTELAEHDAVLNWVGLDGDRVASEGVRLGHLARPGADHGADWCCGRHSDLLGLTTRTM